VQYAATERKRPHFRVLKNFVATVLASATFSLKVLILRGNVERSGLKVNLGIVNREAVGKQVPSLPVE